jgi:hypothetical protein
MPMETGAYRLPVTEVFEFGLSDEGACQLAAALKVWTPTLKGLTKMVTRVRTTWQTRQAHRVSAGLLQFGAAAAAGEGAGAVLLPETW